MTSARRSLLVRVATALVVLPVVLVLIWLPALQVGFAVLIAAFVFQGLREYYALVRTRQLAPEERAGMIAGAAVTLSGLWSSPERTGLALCAAAIVLCSLAVLRGRLSIAGMATSVFGVFYLGWFAAHAVLLHQMERGAGLVTFFIAIVALTDTGAYATGTCYGRHKLIPKVSPGKTWEGAVGGVLWALAASLVFYGLRAGLHWSALPDWSLGRWLVIAAILSVVSQFGDLTESAIKRDAGVKDAGNIFPGHGGVLDRCDSYLFAAPVLYYIVTLGAAN